jgi:hypothetical protein
MESRDTLMQAFDALRDALIACDTEKLRELYAGDYEDFGIRGEIANRDTILEWYKPSGVHIDIFDCRAVRAEVFGDIGIIRGKGCIKGRFADEAFEHHVLFTDIFIFRVERWQYYRSHSTEIKE